VTRPRLAELDELWAHHDARWRGPAQITSQWEYATALDPSLLRTRVSGDWWEVLERTISTLLITREYEHLLVGVCVANSRPKLTFAPLVHPSGVAVDRERETVYVASTRNPNQVYDFAPVTSHLDRGDAEPPDLEGRPLVPVRSRFFPGSLYLHDLALVGGRLHANAVGENAVIRFGSGGGYERVWWPRCIEGPCGPDFSRNYIQLNSIAAGPDISSSCFSASSDRISARRPGHRNYPVDRRGLIYSGRDQEVVVRGLTRPHSARWASDGTLWVDNSGYGEAGVVRDGAFEPMVQLPGWTRGLSIRDGIAFVGTSRVIPRFRQYAPGLDVDRSVCGIHAIDTESGERLGSMVWPYGNQIFSIDWLPTSVSEGFPFDIGERGTSRRSRQLFYSFALPGHEEIDA
jgi:uncharacterized protein (TIGR03032 family)